MSTRAARGKTTGGSRTTTSGDSVNEGESVAPAPASVPVTTAPLDPAAGRKASSDLVTQQQLVLLANQFLSTSRNFIEVDIDISQDADMLALAKSRFDSGIALVGLLEPHINNSRECKSKYSELEVGCFKIASKCGAQPWANRYVHSFRAGSGTSAAAAAAAAAAADASSPIMTLASAAAASAIAPSSTANARPLTAPSAYPMLTQPYQPSLPHLPGSHQQTHNHGMNSSSNNNIGIMQPMPTSERFVVLGRNQKPKEKKTVDVSIPGKGRKKIQPSEMRGKSSNVLSSAMYSIQTHAKNGGKISILLSEAYRRRNDERRNKRKRKFGEVDAAVNKTLHNQTNASAAAAGGGGAHHPQGEEDDDDSEDDEQRAAFYQASGSNARARLPLASPQELQQLEAEMMQSFDATLQSIRRFREARGDFQIPDEKANYFAAFSAPDGRFYGEQGNVQKGEYELMMQLFEALHAKPNEQHCRFSAAKTKYNTFKCPYESFGVGLEDEDEEGGAGHAAHISNNNMNNNNNNNQMHYHHDAYHQQGVDAQHFQQQGSILDSNNTGNQAFNI